MCNTLPVSYRQLQNTPQLYPCLSLPWQRWMLWYFQHSRPQWIKQIIVLKELENDFWWWQIIRELRKKSNHSHLHYLLIVLVNLSISKKIVLNSFLLIWHSSMSLGKELIWSIFRYWIIIIKILYIKRLQFFKIILPSLRIQ